jgi:hypothetical protein
VKPSAATATTAAMVIFIGQIPPTDHTRLGDEGPGGLGSSSGV